LGSTRIPHELPRQSCLRATTESTQVHRSHGAMITAKSSHGCQRRQRCPHDQPAGASAVFGTSELGASLFYRASHQLQALRVQFFDERKHRAEDVVSSPRMLIHIRPCPALRWVVRKIIAALVVVPASTYLGIIPTLRLSCVAKVSTVCGVPSITGWATSMVAIAATSKHWVAIAATVVTSASSAIVTSPHG